MREIPHERPSPATARRIAAGASVYTVVRRGWHLLAVLGRFGWPWGWYCAGICAVGYSVEWRLSHIAAGEKPSAAAIAELAGAPDDPTTGRDDGISPLAVATTSPVDSTRIIDIATTPAARLDSLRVVREQLYRALVRHMAVDLYATGWVTAPRAQRLAEWVVSESLRQGIPPALVFGVMLVENDRFKSGAVSSAGARGLMQIMPFWTRSLARLYGDDLTDDATNIQYGVHILTQTVARRGLRQGLLGYNGCVRGTHTPDCFLYPYKVQRRVELYARRSCPSRDYTRCVDGPLTRARALALSTRR